MRRTNIYLDEAQTASLDDLAEQEGISRAELIRRLLSRALAGDDRTAGTDLSAIEDSFGALSDLQAPVRGPDAREQHLADIWERRR